MQVKEKVSWAELYEQEVEANKAEAEAAEKEISENPQKVEEENEVEVEVEGDDPTKEPKEEEELEFEIEGEEESNSDTPEKGSEEEPEQENEENEEKSTSEEDFEAKIKAYAEKKDLSVEAAKEIFDHVGKIREKYGDDQEKIALSNYHLQKTLAEKDQKISELSKKQDLPKSVTHEQVKEEIRAGKLILPQGKALLENEVVELYRKRKPELTEVLSDEEVFNAATREMAEEHNRTLASREENLPKLIDERKSQLLNSIPQGLPKNVEETVKELLKGAGREVVSDNFSVDQVVLLAKGINHDALMAEAKKKWIKQGKEEAKVLKKTPPVKAKTASKGSQKIRLTKEQADDALRTFSNSEPKVAYKLYYESVIKNREKK